MRKIARVFGSAIATAALATLSFSGAAFAAPSDDQDQVDGTSQSASNPALINPDATVQLSIHKYLGGQTGDANNGTILDPVPAGSALDGVNFDVYKVEGVDLTTNAGWAAASAINNLDLSTAIESRQLVVGDVTYTVKYVDTVTTADGGTADFTATNGVGLYLINENLSTSGTITDAADEVVDTASITPSAPFLVTLPMTNPDSLNEWMYDVHVYPKNQSDTITKTVEDMGTVTAENGNVGDHEIVYTITTSITDGTGKLGKYVVNDQLDPRVEYKSATVTLSNAVTLTETTDYTLTELDGLVTVTFTEAGLEILEDNREANVVTTITTTALKEGVDGRIPNTATFIPNENWYNENWTPDKPGIPSEEVVTYYGDVIVNKQDPQETGADMSGAEFAIYADPTPGDGACSAADVTDQTAIATGSIDNTGLDAGAEGYNQLVFTGLQASNWYDNAEQTALLSYCLVETKAPEGYNLDATAHYITIDYKTGVANTTPAYATELVNNEKTNLNNNLPLTGGEGVLMVSGLGLVLVGGGFAYYMVNRRKESRA